MYSAFGFRRSEIGDVDVLWHDGLFHLFHLVLPNHDYIAHAVSEDGLAWRRVPNALFIADPGAWDDDMLWTMHVTADPHRPGRWRMFYAGLRLQERGLVQRVGMARSDDLYHWERDAAGPWPLEIPGDHYEHSVEEGRQWVSFRDPFYVRHDGTGYLLAAARSNRGPLIRRGCVALAEETAPGRFEFRPPLFHPRRYDDVEVPCLFHREGRFYLLGSIREDVKVHYWVADRLEGPYGNFADNVLLPQGNYAARTCVHPEFDRLLVWNYFFTGDRSAGDHILPPPKEIEVAATGELVLRSYRGFDEKVIETREAGQMGSLEPLLGTPGARVEPTGGSVDVASESGFEVFVAPGTHCDVRLSGSLEPGPAGKPGLALHLDPSGGGYFVSLDPAKGIAQIRYWADDPAGGFEHAFTYDQLQAGHFVPRPGPVPFVLLSYGTYLELSLFGEVVLTLADARRSEGRLGVYVESGRLRITGLRLDTLASSHPAAGTQDPLERS